ncbi:tRNA pseudouridine38-40 synthase [Halogranum amylolyticum]|uniref:tRNA pseudouridine synthase A n=1 Tax=Halogranum amylolyticum TaxID=660520 RepID=A0A1H8WSR3_9EURY|nr:tRNA pseudouridine(38-40) synthase TruA [Halogranum amylolyticum]SEP30754.1 tRNA pseudouridine38-40 synthase [Halogranum amylolyticum]
MRAFRVAYDGRPFYGFQRQPSVPTVEDSLFDALRRLGVLDETADKPTGYAAAGRTDAGVSAVAQTVAFDPPEWCTPRALNSELPSHVRAWAAADVPADFHATHHAVRRRYSYHLYAPTTEFDSLDGRDHVDDDRARTALDALCGEHDFHNLTPDDTGTVRELTGDLTRDGEFLVVRVESGGFARELVRRLVSLVQAVGSGSAPIEKIERVLGSEPIDGPEGVPPAPPTPLVLTGVDYPGVAFECDETAVASTRSVFGERAVEGRVRRRVADTVLAAVGSE